MINGGAILRCNNYEVYRTDVRYGNKGYWVFFELFKFDLENERLKPLYFKEDAEMLVHELLNLPKVASMVKSSNKKIRCKLNFSIDLVNSDASDIIYSRNLYQISIEKWTKKWYIASLSTFVGDRKKKSLFSCRISHSD